MPVRDNVIRLRDHRRDRVSARGPGRGFTQDEERRLVEAFKQGDEDACDHIYRGHCGMVHAICLRILGDYEDAREAAQDTFMKVFRSLDRFDCTYRLSSWITRVAVNAAIDRLRWREKHLVASENIEDLSPSDAAALDAGSWIVDPEEVALKSAEGRRIHKTLEKLPLPHRQALLLREVYGFSYREIAKALHVSECQVKNYLHRGRRAFREAWPHAAPMALVTGKRSACELSTLGSTFTGANEAIMHNLQLLSQKMTAAAAVVVIGTTAIPGPATNASLAERRSPSPDRPRVEHQTDVESSLKLRAANTLERSLANMPLSEGKGGGAARTASRCGSDPGDRDRGDSARAATCHGPSEGRDGGADASWDPVEEPPIGDTGGDQMEKGKSLDVPLPADGDSIAGGAEDGTVGGGIAEGGIVEGDTGSVSPIDTVTPEHPGTAPLAPDATDAYENDAVTGQSGPSAVIPTDTRGQRVSTPSIPAGTTCASGD